MLTRAGFVTGLLTWAHAMTLAQNIPGEPPVEVRIRVAPAPAQISGQTVLAYELHITNLLRREIGLNRIEVPGDGST